MRELLLHLTHVADGAGDAAGDVRVEVFSTNAAGDVRRLGELFVPSALVPTIRGYADALIPQLVPDFALIWAGPALQPAVAPAVAVVKVVKLARSLKLLPS